MGKNCGISHCSRHRVQLSLFKGNIAGMDGGRHRLFQGILPVYLQDRLLPAGCGDTFLHSQLSGILTAEQYGDMKYGCHIEIYITQYNGAVLSGGSFCIRNLMERQQQEYGLEKKEQYIQLLTDRRTTGQSWQTLLSDGKVAPCGFGKNHPHRSGSGIFPENLALPEAAAVPPL